MYRQSFRSALLVAALAGGVFAPRLSAQTNTFSAGTVFNSPDLTGFTTVGSQMVGMVVSWDFVGGGAPSTGVWGDIGGGIYGVSAGGFSVIYGGGNSFGETWTVTNGTQSAVAAVQFNGAPGRTLFDCDWTGTTCSNSGAPSFEEGTAGSARGWSMETSGGTYGGQVFGFYSNRVGINGAAPVGDLYEQLRIVFGTGGLGIDETYAFIADTDNSLFDAPPPSSDVVPEPATMTLLATGLAGMAATRRRKKQK